MEAPIPRTLINQEMELQHSQMIIPLPVMRMDRCCRIGSSHHRRMCWGLNYGAVKAAVGAGNLRIFFEMLGQAVRRPLIVGCPGWCGLTGDERQLLGLIAVPQDDAQPRLDALLCWVARVEARPRLAIAIRRFRGICHP